MPDKIKKGLLLSVLLALFASANSAVADDGFSDGDDSEIAADGETESYAEEETSEPQMSPRVVAAMENIPVDEYDLISAYDAAGLVYHSGNTRELLAVDNALDRRNPALAAELIDTFPNLATETYTIKRSGETLTLLIYVAGRDGSIELARRLISLGADVNAVSSDGERALSRALRNRQRELIRLLIESGADVDFKTRDGKLMVDLTDDPGLKQMIINAKKSFNADDLKSALREHRISVDMVKRILNSGVKPDTECMVLTIRKNDSKILALLLAAGGDPNAKDRGNPIIFRCSYRGDIECAKLLIDYGADTDFVLPISGRTHYHKYLKARNANALLNYINTASSRSRKSASAAKTPAAPAKKKGGLVVVSSVKKSGKTAGDSASKKAPAKPEAEKPAKKVSDEKFTDAVIIR